MLYAAIDVGTNSCRLLIAEPEGAGLKPFCRDIRTTRIGQGAAASGVLSPLAVERTLECLKEFKTTIDGCQAVLAGAVATSAVREAANRGDFIDRAAIECGVQVQVIDGEEEAALSYLGVKRGLRLRKPPLVADLGGGSTEFMLEDQEGIRAVSLPLGAVRATEARMEVAAIKHLLSALDGYKEKWAKRPLVFVGGTATTLAAIKLELSPYRPELVHGQALSYQEVSEIHRKLSGMTLEERQNLPGLQAERADIICAGALIIKMIMETLNCHHITVSESDILDGLIWRCLGC